MKRVGIGGVLIMEVDQGAPVGPVAFMGTEWRELFKLAVAEAGRLGLEINMNNDAGWNGSGGPWITPEQSMQKIVWSRDRGHGPGPLRRDAPAAGDRPRVTTGISPCWPSRRRATIASTASRARRFTSGGRCRPRRDRAAGQDDRSPGTRSSTSARRWTPTAASPGTFRQGSGRSCASGTPRPGSRTPRPRRAAAASSATSSARPGSRPSSPG